MTSLAGSRSLAPSRRLQVRFYLRMRFSDHAFEMAVDDPDADGCRMAAPASRTASRTMNRYLRFIGKLTLFEAPLAAVMVPWTLTWTSPLYGLARLIVTVLPLLLGLTPRIASVLVKTRLFMLLHDLRHGREDLIKARTARRA